MVTGSYPKNDFLLITWNLLMMINNRMYISFSYIWHMTLDLFQIHMKPPEIVSGNIVFLFSSRTEMTVIIWPKSPFPNSLNIIDIIFLHLRVCCLVMSCYLAGIFTIVNHPPGLQSLDQFRWAIQYFFLLSLFFFAFFSKWGKQSNNPAPLQCCVQSVLRFSPRQYVRSP